MGGAGALALPEWLTERRRRHRADTDVVRQHLQREFGIGANAPDSLRGHAGTRRAAMRQAALPRCEVSELAL